MLVFLFCLFFVCFYFFFFFFFFYISFSFFFFFFFQAEDGIRDVAVTGVQTCALPISIRSPRPVPLAFSRSPLCIMPSLKKGREDEPMSEREPMSGRVVEPIIRGREIGRASCRERVEMTVVGGVVKKKKDKENMCVIKR